MGDSILYKLTSGKPNKLLFLIRGFAGRAVPGWVFRLRLPRVLRQARLRPDWDYMCRRADYYMRLSAPFTLP